MNTTSEAVGQATELHTKEDHKITGRLSFSEEIPHLCAKYSVFKILSS